MRKKIISCILVLAVAIAFMPTSAFAASKVKMTCYDDVYKTGNTVYCAGCTGLYKVKVTKKGKAKSVKTLFDSKTVSLKRVLIYNMKKKGNYIYFLVETDLAGEGNPSLWRVKTNGKHLKRLAYGFEYAIKGKKIYYVTLDPKTYANIYHVMKLNGKAKKKAKRGVKINPKASNTKKYKVLTFGEGGYTFDYLDAPVNTKFLGKEPMKYWDK